MNQLSLPPKSFIRCTASLSTAFFILANSWFGSSKNGTTVKYNDLVGTVVACHTASHILSVMEERMCQHKCNSSAFLLSKPVICKTKPKSESLQYSVQGLKEVTTCRNFFSPQPSLMKAQVWMVGAVNLFPSFFDFTKKIRRKILQNGCPTHRL